MEKLLSVFSKDPIFFAKKIQIISETTTTLDEILGVISPTIIKTNIDINYEHYDLFMLRLIQSVGLLYEFSFNLAINSSDLSFKKHQLKPNKKFSLVIEISHEFVQIKEKKGFGWFFYNEKDMSAVVSSVFYHYKKYLLSIKTIKEKDKTILQKIYDEILLRNLETTDDIMSFYSKLLSKSKKLDK